MLKALSSPSYLEVASTLLDKVDTMKRRRFPVKSTAKETADWQATAVKGSIMRGSKKDLSQTDGNHKSTARSTSAPSRPNSNVPTDPGTSQKTPVDLVAVEDISEDAVLMAHADGETLIPTTFRNRKHATGKSASRLIDQWILQLEGWRGEALARIRTLILKAGPDITEEWKDNNPVWLHHGVVCRAESFTKAVKLTFARGASLPDPSQLFNSRMEDFAQRAIDIHEGTVINGSAFKAIMKAALAQNAPPAKKTKPGERKLERAKVQVPQEDKSTAVLLSGGNPQIAKGDGDSPVQAYISAMPGWKSELGRRLDTLIVRTVPNVSKAVKWNTPFYGIEGEGWFVAYHCFTKYVKVTFFRGTSLSPIPPGESKQQEVRYFDIYEDDELDEAQFTDWVRQASQLPGERL